MPKASPIATALDPRANVVVEACAGSGKTWLLVARMVRLLLAGAQPSEILAITFTRKAAQEMESRLRHWLRTLALESDDEAREFLRDRHVPDAEIDALLTPARHLLERFLTAEPPITISTFHSWFLELLQRAPLDAGAVGRVTLLEQTSQLMNEAWDEFVQSLRHADNAALAANFNALLAGYGLHNTRLLLQGFVRERVRWWAFVGHRKKPVDYALDELRAALGIGGSAGARAGGAASNARADGTTSGNADAAAPASLAAADPLAALAASAACRAAVAELTAALARGTAANKKWAEALDAALANADPAAAFAAACDVLLTKSGSPADKPAKAADKLGAAAAHRAVCEALDAARMQLAELAVLAFHEAALPCAAALIERYQDLKRQRDGMDFADVEWRAWQLLTRSDHAEYMQYKLDARYRHILVDEFQDTSPIQWQILRAWLAASTEAGRSPTVFLVGDPKQSIYRFRGAEARLFHLGQDYVHDELAGHRVSIPVSRRCAPAVIELVNRVFGPEEIFEGFEEHAAHDKQLPGRIEVLPLAQAAEPEPVAAASLLRDPLTTPRPEDGEPAREVEARQLTAKLKEIVDHWIVRDERTKAPRPARYGDVMILVRRRTHLAVYERALRAARIPYLTSRQGGLLQTLEAADLTALLRFLITPFADLNLAIALRSPIFAASDDDLAALAALGEGSWRHRLARLVNEGRASPALERAHRLLDGWLGLVDHLPVHDLLDRIYFQGDVVARYRAAVPEAMREGVAANLQAFVELALALDAGRYPSLPRFLDELQALRQAEAEEAPDEGVVGEAGNSVRILTVHGAKGLEAPIVWLLDTHAAERGADSYRVLADWPPEAERPAHFSLLTVQAERGRARDALLEREAALQAREELNVLYVAITRARQALIVSGSANSKADQSWYRRIATALGTADTGATLGDDLTTADRHPGEAPIGRHPGEHPSVRHPGAGRDPEVLGLARHPGEGLPDRRPGAGRKDRHPGAGRDPEVLGLDRHPGESRDPGFSPSGSPQPTHDPRLSHPLPTGKREAAVSTPETRRGERLHFLLQHLAPPNNVTELAWLQDKLAIPDDDFADLLADAKAILAAPDLARFFDPARYLRAANEVPFVTAAGELRRIDRVVEFADEVWILDYKTGDAASGQSSAIFARYRRQLTEYAAAMAAVHGGKAVSAGVILQGGALFKL